jgi:TonB family protein
VLESANFAASYRGVFPGRAALETTDFEQSWGIFVSDRSVLSTTPFLIESTLPRPWRSMAISYAVQSVGVLLLVKIALIAPAAIAPLQHRYEAIALASTAPKEPVPSIATKVVSAPPAVAQPAIVLPRRTEVAKIEAPAPVLPAKTQPMPVTAMAAVPPAKVIATGTFDSQPVAPVRGNPAIKLESAGFSGSSATPTTSAPARAVQTGGFGDPDGIAGSSNKPGLHAAAVGAFDLAAGGGAGNGTGGTRGIRGVVASTGFGDGMAGSGSGDRGGRSGRGGASVSDAGFNASEPARATPARREPAAEQATPVQILSKPSPVYTEEARRMKIEGEVVLRILFGADGTIRDISVVRGLGHGLDEAAMLAARKIQFQPAHRGPQPVDYTAVVHVTFQLA